MNKLKKITFGLLLSASTAGLYGEESEQVTNSYNYVGIGAGFPTVLSLKFGHREQWGHHGVDIGFGGTPLIMLMEVHGFANYLYYPHPNLSSQTYFGLGLRAGRLEIFNGLRSTIIRRYVAPEVTIGNEYLTTKNRRRFMQVALGAGGWTTRGLKLMPSMIITYGFAF